jgi:hypothetical protein
MTPHFFAVATSRRLSSWYGDLSKFDASSALPTIQKVPHSWTLRRFWRIGTPALSHSGKLQPRFTASVY